MVGRLKRWASKAVSGRDRRAREAVESTPTHPTGAPPQAREPSATVPRLVGLRFGGPGAELVIEDSAVAGQLDASALLLVARKSQSQLCIDLVDGTATVTAEHLENLGSEVVDLYVARADGRRHRVAAGDAVFPAQTGSPRRFYTTNQGNVSIRRRNQAEIIDDSGAFDADYYRAQVPGLGADVDPIQHYLDEGASSGLNPCAMFDTKYYQDHNPRVLHWNPFAHFCEHGWQELRNPAPQFNTWWYWAKHLDFADNRVNPLAHYLRIGQRAGLSTIPDPHPSQRLGEGYRHRLDRPVRRLCLFGGYDPQGIVDEYVVDFIRELSRFADVFYLADCEMPADELGKLAGLTKGAWSERHGEYDFGSYARLVVKVGWSTIEEYDELLLVNDSSFLLRPLDDVFAKMNARACDWWGLQATKGLYQTREQPQNTFDHPIPITEVRADLVDTFETDYTYDFHVASYFVAYRTPVITDPEFRRYLGSVTAQVRKRDIVKKYEIGLTHWLIQHGHVLDTFVPWLYPFHPVFTHWYFRLLADGFPLLKRQLLAENLYQVPDLVNWHQRVRDSVPDADLDVVDRHLYRVVGPEQLRNSLAGSDPRP